VTDPTGPESGQYRVLRGGCWVDDAVNLRPARRFAKPPDSEDRCFGFRVVLECR
jgi:formylglycine-generating enzyme required for sulfatase activity